MIKDFIIAAKNAESAKNLGRCPRPPKTFATFAFFAAKKLFALFAIALISFCSASANALPLTWRADWPDAKPVETLVHRGTDIELQPTWYINKAPADTNGWTYTTFCQTNAVGPWFGPLPGAFFSHTNDVGAAFYNVMVRAQTPAGAVNYTAFARLRMLDSPGFAPGELPLPVATIDFSKVVALNAPWLLPDATNGFIKVEIDPTVPGATNALNASLSSRLSQASQAATNYTDEAVAAQSAAQSAALADATNDLSAALSAADAAVSRGATNYTDAVAAALSAAKQDKLPYPTNEIPQSVISGLSTALAGKLDKTGGTVMGLTVEDASMPIFSIKSANAEAAFWMNGTNVMVTVFNFNTGSVSTYHFDRVVDDEVAVLGDLQGLGVDLSPATNYTDSVAGELATSIAGKYPNASGQQLAQQVAAIGAHINGEDAKVMVTNYNSSTHLPEAEFHINISNSWIAVWREMTRWNWFLGDVFDPHTNAVARALANKAEKEYAFYDGVTGEPAPDGFFWISQPRVAICAGAAYQRYVDTAGEVWVLESNGMVADINGTTNGYFRISDDKGNVQFEIVKGDSRTVTAAAGAMTRSSVMGVTHWHTTYMVTNAVSAPKAMFCRDLANPEWYAEDDAGCPCNVDWTHPSEEIYVCEWWTQGNEPKMFMRSQYGQGSESRIVQNAPVEMQYIVIGGTKYALGTATIDGKTVLTLSTP